MSEPLRILYENHRGETRERTLAAPIMIFRESRWHEGSQWLISALDTESNAMRDFAVSGIRSQAQAARIAELEAELAEATKERAEEDAELAKWRAFAWKNRCEVCGGESYRPVIGHDYIHGDVYGPEEPCPANCGELRLRFGSIDAEMESIALALVGADGPAHRARIAREFEHEAQLEYEASLEYPAGPHPAIAAGNRVLARWEAAAKGSVEP